MTGWGTLVQADTLADSLDHDGLVVVDCRFNLADTGAGEAAFREAHIPGACYAHLDRDLSGMHQPGKGRHPWPEASEFTARLGDWGVGPHHQVVAYDDGSGAIAARLWFLLRALGHDKVAVLDGGWTHWVALGMPVERELQSSTKQRYCGHFDQARLLGPAQVQTHLSAGGLLLDARAEDRFAGENETLDALAGHVPGAQNRPFADNLVDGCFKPATQLADEFETLLAGRDSAELVAMCGSGVTACHHLLALEYAGLGAGKLFTGSWSGWIEDPARPVARD